MSGEELRLCEECEHYVAVGRLCDRCAVELAELALAPVSGVEGALPRFPVAVADLSAPPIVAKYCRRLAGAPPGRPDLTRGE